MQYDARFSTMMNPMLQNRLSSLSEVVLNSNKKNLIDLHLRDSVLIEPPLAVPFIMSKSQV